MSQSTPPTPPYQGPPLMQPPPPAGYYAAPAPPPPARGSGIASRMVSGFIVSLLLTSLLLNVYFGIGYASMVSGPREQVYREGDMTRRIVVLPIRGVINEGTAAHVHQVLDHLRKNPPAALILRVESPGGGLGASDRILHDIKAFKTETNTHIVASFGDLAASGGYYISMASDTIVAEPTTITGSIGAVVQGYLITDLLDKVGVDQVTIPSTRATEKTVLSSEKKEDWQPGGKTFETWRHFLDEGHVRFATVVQEGRKKHFESVEKLWESGVATGMVFSAQEALDKKLVDSVGYLNDAIDEAQKLAGIPSSTKPAVMIIQPPQSLLSAIGLKTQQSLPLSTQSGEDLRDQLSELTHPRVEYRWAP